MGGASQEVCVSSLSLRSAIEDALNVPPVALQILLEKDRIVLRGTVSSAIERRTIEMAARDVRGARNVVNQLRVRSGAAGSS